MSYKTLDEVNNLENEEFEFLFRNVIELYPSAAREVKSKRPFGSVQQLCDAFHKYLDDTNEEEKLMILKLHPDLAGRLAEQERLTTESSQEQQSAGLDKLTEEHKNMINKYNQRYKTKFGFPFIICARENKVQSIITGLQHRLENSRSSEILTGIQEVKKICRLRILDIVQDK